jgi:quercetin dioxygenase-like cupin family protein
METGMNRIVLLTLLCSAVAGAQPVRILRFAEAKEFRMGKVVSRRIVHPEMGARQITLNYSPTVMGHEFSQHVHETSDDTIVIFKGQADLRQGDSRRRFQAGQSVFVPAGQIHGTITMEDATEMISFQTPPDMALYTGARDSSRTGAGQPNGAITPGAVKYARFDEKNGLFVHPGMGAKRIAAGYRRIKPGESFVQSIGNGAEAVVFVWKGAVQAITAGAPATAGEKDAVFAQGPAKLELRNASGAEAVIVHALAPPGGHR